MSERETRAPGTAGATQAPSFPRPLPKLEGDSLPYWRALAQGRIELPRCRRCSAWIFYPRPFCPRCLASDIAWERVEGRGTVYAFTVVHKPTNPYFFGEAPYVYAIVELACGVRLPTRIVGCPPDIVRVGAPVEAHFERVSDDVTLLYFAPL
jgi:uncharacterized OB-fold protein